MKDGWCTGRQPAPMALSRVPPRLLVPRYEPHNCISGLDKLSSSCMSFSARPSHALLYQNHSGRPVWHGVLWLPRRTSTPSISTLHCSIGTNQATGGIDEHRCGCRRQSTSSVHSTPSCACATTFAGFQGPTGAITTGVGSPKGACKWPETPPSLV